MAADVACQQDANFLPRSGKHIATEHYIDPDNQLVDYRSLQKMFRILAEVCRQRKRSWLSAAKSITITLDDRNEFKAVRFKCDYLADWQGKTGLLALIRRLAGIADKEIEDFEEDYAVRQVAAITSALRSFFTSIKGVFHEDMFQHLCTHVRALGSDGATKEVKTLYKLRQQLFPNAVVIIRDAAHAVRIAVRDPLLADCEFKAMWDLLFDGEHALIKDIHYSDKLRSKLEACQKRVLKVKGKQGGNLDKVLKHFSWAKQQFESIANMHRKLGCLITAVVHVVGIHSWRRA